MARKFGKKNEIKLDPLAYNLCLIGEGGIGKTTLIKQYCERLSGPNGYIFLDCGKEDGSDAINGIVSEPVWDWEKFDAVTTDIIENRYTDYADLKVVIIDTFDELMNLAESEVVRLWNRDNPDKRTKSFKATFGGFNGPTDKAIEIVVHTGISAQCPHGCFLAVYARSGLGIKHGIVPSNCVGVIDEDYRGEIMVALYNHSDKDFEFKLGDRIAQMVLQEYKTCELEFVYDLEETERGVGGFGSTGK